MRIYELNSAYNDAIERANRYAEENEGEVSEELISELEKLELSIEEKIDNTASYIKDLVAESKAVKEESAKLAQRAKAVDCKVERLKGFLSYLMPTDKFKSERNLISFRNTTKTIVDNAEEIPTEFITVKETRTPDKVAIKKAIESGSIVSGAHIESSKAIQIK